MFKTHARPLADHSFAHETVTAGRAQLAGLQIDFDSGTAGSNLCQYHDLPMHSNCTAGMRLTLKLS